MILFPAVDIMNKRAVRLLYGLKGKVTDYGDPIDFALSWQDKGAEFLHIVDLDGAFQDGGNVELITKIAKSVDIPIQTGGGIKTLDDIKRRLDEGVNRVIIGTMAYEKPDEVFKAIEIYKEKIVLGLDTKDGFIAIKGWVEKTEFTALDFIEKFKGIKTAVYTDISRDGAMTGVDVDGTVKLQKESKIDIIASGGVSSLEDIKKLAEKECYGAILGRSLYNGAINFEDALSLSRSIT